MKTNERYVNIRIGYISLFAFYVTHGLWWFRILGFGVYCRDDLKHHVPFAERYGYVKCFKISHWRINMSLYFI